MIYVGKVWSGWTVWEYTNKAASEIKMKIIGKGALLY